MFAGADLRIQELSHLNQYAGIAEPKGPSFFKINNDPRVTRVGSISQKFQPGRTAPVVECIVG